MTRGFSVENKALLTIMGTNLCPIDHLTTLNSGCSRFLYDLISSASPLTSATTSLIVFVKKGPKLLPEMAYYFPLLCSRFVTIFRSHQVGFLPCGFASGFSHVDSRFVGMYTQLDILDSSVGWIEQFLHVPSPPPPSLPAEH
nr:hypothetical protein CFP56_14046 [Quercus suber]